MTKDEALDLALEALETPRPTDSYPPLWRSYKKTINDAITAIKQARSAPVQEPVALPCCGYTDASAIKWNPFNGVVQCHNCGQTYTPPAAQRPWVGLTDEEMKDALISVDAETRRLPPGFKDFARAIEARLKEKNT
jgi:hypothetical protein